MISDLARSNVARSIAVIGILWIPAMLRAQDRPTVPTAPATEFAEPMRIRRQAVPELPFSVVGPRGAILGTQDGSFEAWVFPWKILNGVHLTVNMENYAVPIDVNHQAAEIDVEPDNTTITYSHANFTIRQTMVAPKTGQQDVGAMVLYQIEAIRPLTLTVSFNPVMQRMWPAESPDRPSPEWVKSNGGSGFYILHLNFPDEAAALAMPGAEPGILPPYQERPDSWPLQFVLHYDPERDVGRSYPLLIGFGNSSAATTKEAFDRSLADTASNVDAICAANRDYYRNFLAQHTAIETSDGQLDAAFAWAETAIDQLRVETGPGAKQEGLTAGFVGSGDAARPGFGWFFGRDSLWSLYAVNSYGDFATTKQEIQFLLDHQRSDGKIMHERSQTAALVDWSSLPYEWASSDATPLLAMAANDYLKISNDREFVASIWPNLERAWTFETTHDTDGDGIYDNSEGSGWVESWVPTMPHQEIYLAAVDEQASLAFSDLARAAGHNDLADQARQRAIRIAKTIEAEYYLPGSQSYAFSWNGEGHIDETATVFPAVAWWDGTYQLKSGDAMMGRWAASEFSTDWGVRDVSDRTGFYDPISYHQGSVWPLFTGWVSLAEYRAGHPLSGYAHLMQDANLTWAQDLGDVTELLSGQFYQVLGRSTAHQLWSSAMVISPILRGMFGLEWNAPGNTLTVTPHLPASWMNARVHRLPFGNKMLDISFRREGQELVVQASDSGVRLASLVRGAMVRNGALHIPLPAVEVGMDQHLPEFGAETRQMKVLSEKYEGRTLVLQLSAPGNSVQKLEVRENASPIRLATKDAELGAPDAGMRSMLVRFPESGGYVGKTVTLSW
jgi:glycogen debranching enzyme